MLKEKEREVSRFLELLRSHPRGLTIEEISKLLPLNRNAASKYLNRMLVAGQVEMRTFGPAKVFFLSKRLPLPELLNLTSDMIMVLDHELFIRYVNDRLLDVFGIDRVDLIAHQIDHTPFASYINPPFRQKIINGERGEEGIHEEVITVQGIQRNFHAKCVPVVFEEGEQGVSLVIQDITVQKPASQQVTECPPVDSYMDS